MADPKTATEKMRLVLDGWVNTLSGLGTSRDKRSNTSLQPSIELNYQALDTLYNENWVARRIVELLPAQAFRKEPTGIDENDWKRWHALNQHELYPHGVFLQGLFAGRCFGGAVIIPGFKRGAPTDPAPEPGAGSDMYWLDVVPWHMLTIDARETDANSPRYKLPKILRITGQHPRAGLTFNIDRAVICEGVARAQPTVIGTNVNLVPWQSVLQAVQETLRDYDVSWGAVSNLLDEASIGVMKLQGLFKMLAEKDQTVAQARMASIAVSKSMIKTLFLDADGNESFERTEVSFASLPQLMQQINLRTAGAANLPATKLFGQEPAGMNATGESDIRQFYDDVAEYRTRNSVKLEKLMSWALGRPVQLDWPSLWEQTDKEQANTRLLNAQADKIWAVDIGCLNALDVAKSRAEDGSFGLEVDLAEIEKDIADQAKKAENAPAPIAPGTQPANPITANPQPVPVGDDIGVELILEEYVLDFDPDQPRAENGEWGTGGAVGKHTLIVSGNTYAHRDKLKALGFSYNKPNQTWNKDVQHPVALPSHEKRTAMVKGSSERTAAAADTNRLTNGFQFKDVKISTMVAGATGPSANYRTLFVGAEHGKTSNANSRNQNMREGLNPAKYTPIKGSEPGEYE